MPLGSVDMGPLGREIPCFCFNQKHFGHSWNKLMLDGETVIMLGIVNELRIKHQKIKMVFIC